MGVEGGWFPPPGWINPHCGEFFYFHILLIEVIIRTNIHTINQSQKRNKGVSILYASNFYVSLYMDKVGEESFGSQYAIRTCLPLVAIIRTDFLLSGGKDCILDFDCTNME